MEAKCIPKRILESNFIGKRPVGKPRKRWIDEVEIRQQGDLESEKLDKRSSR
jgi:hypothetical protein